MPDDNPTTLERAAATAATSHPRAHQPHKTDDHLPLGTRAGDFELVEALASGGCGTVYRAHHVASFKVAAVKVLNSNLAKSPEMVLRFLREAQAVNQIRHPNIIDIDECGLLANNQPYMLMEYLAGNDVAQHLRINGRVTPQRCLEIVEPVCRALDAAHKAGFVHRDVKASNVFLATQNGREVVKLLDFGIAKLLNPEPGAVSLTRTRHTLGSAQTMAPEQVRGGPIGPATDVYGVGALIFVLLVGRYPFSGLGVAELERRILGSTPPRPSEIVPMPPALDEVVGRCLEKRAEARYSSTLELLEHLRAAVTSAPAAAIAHASASGVYMDIRMVAGADEDDAIDAVEVTLEQAESLVVDAGFTVVVSTGSSLLAVKLHDAAQEDDASLRQQAATLAANLYDELAVAENAGFLEVALTVHAGPVRLSNDRPVSGALLEVASWAPWSGAGAFGTDEALRGVTETRLTRRH